MKQTLPWNVNGIPPDVREAARAAALKEGVSVGDWLTRRILAEDKASNGADADIGARSAPGYRLGYEAAARRESERDQPAQRRRNDLPRNEVEADSALRRIDESVRAMSQRLDTTERSNKEAHRAMSTAASEINAAARDQAQAFALLNQRIERVERQTDTATMREAIRVLHQGLARLAEKNAQTSTEATGHVAQLAANLESVATKLARMREGSDELERLWSERVSALTERLRQAEERIASGGRAMDAVAALEARMHASEERLQQIMALESASDRRFGESMTALDTRLRNSEEQLKSAFLRQGISDRRFEETVAGLDARMRASEDLLKSELSKQGASDRRVEETVAVLDARVKAAEEQLRTGLARHAAAGDRLEQSVTALERHVKSSEERLQEAFTRHLASIERNLDTIALRIEQAERRGGPENGVQDALRVISQRMEQAEKKNRDTLSDLSNSLGDVAKRIDTMETAKLKEPQRVPVEKPLPSEGRNFDLPPLPDSALTPPRVDFHSMLTPEAADVFPSRPEQVPAEAQDYLEQARRAAQAAADPNTGRKPQDAPALGSARKRVAKSARPVGVAALAILVATAGFMLTEMWMARNQVATVASGPDVPLGTGAESSTPSGLAGGSFPAPSETGADQTVAAGPPADTVSVPPPAAAPPAARTTATPPPRPVAAQGPAPNGLVERLTAKANSGDAKAELLLGLKYADADGLQQNDGEALRWLQKAAQAGEPLAQYRLGTLYEKGRGVKADVKQAASWYEQAAARGNRKAMHNLAVAYADGAGKERNYGEAARWFRNAAELGLTDSQFNLAVLYERGLGVPASLSEAYKWYAIAASLGDNESKVRVDALATQLQPAEREASERAAKAYKVQTLNVAANDPPPFNQVAP